MRALLLGGLLASLGCAGRGDLAFSAELVDFGLAVPGIKRTQPVNLINRGDARLVISEARSSSTGFSLSLTPIVDGGVGSTLVTLAPGQVREVSVNYFPSTESNESEEATIEVSTEQGVSATLRVSGIPTTPDCTLPTVLDFGPVARGDTLTQEVALRNSTERSATAFVGPIEAAQGTAEFSAASGTFELPASGVHMAAISFTPTEARDYGATVRMSRHPLCVEKPVRLIGTGVGATLSWSPATSDFGTVTIGTTSCQSLTLSNLMLVPVSLTQVAVREGANPSSVFSTPSSSLTVPGARRDETGTISPGTASIEVCCAASAAGPRAGQLTAVTNLAAQSNISVNLRCVGMQ